MCSTIADNLSVSGRSKTTDGALPERGGTLNKLAGTYFILGPG